MIDGANVDPITSSTRGAELMQLLYDGIDADVGLAGGTGADRCLEARITGATIYSTDPRNDANSVAYSGISATFEIDETSTIGGS